MLNKIENNIKAKTSINSIAQNNAKPLDKTQKNITELQNVPRPFIPSFSGVIKADQVEKTLEKGVRQIVGQLQLPKRNGTTATVNITRIQSESGNVRIQLEEQGKTLITGKVSPFQTKSTCKTDHVEVKNSMILDDVDKYKAGNDYINLAKIMDILAVKESLAMRLKGNVSLEAGFSSSPLHHSRGYKNIEYKKWGNDKQIEYDNNYKKMFSDYVEARKQGLEIKDAKRKMSSDDLSNEYMILSDEARDAHIQIADKIKYSAEDVPVFDINFNKITTTTAKEAKTSNTPLVTYSLKRKKQ